MAESKAQLILHFLCITEVCGAVSAVCVGSFTVII